MKKKPPRTPPSRAIIAKPAQDAGAVAKEVERYSTRLAELFKELGDLPPRSEARAAELDSEIRRVTKEMNDLREQTGHWYTRKGTDPNDEGSRLRRETEAKKLELRKRLGRIADAQVALVAEWNADPTAEKREAFDREYRRLAQEYSAARAELQKVRDELAKL